MPSSDLPAPAPSRLPNCRPKVPPIGLARLVWLGLVAVTAGCVPIEEPPLLDETGEPIPIPQAYDRWLQVVEVLPEASVVSPEASFTLIFNAYLQDDALLDYATVFLSSGGLRAYGAVRHVVSRRALVFEPYGPLEPGLVWSLHVDPTRLQSVTGAPASIGPLPEFRVEEEVEEPTPALPLLAPPSRWPRVEAIFARKCFNCHRDPSWGLNPLRPETLIGERSEQVDRYLVRPFDAADSYLLHKVLPDFPLRRFTVQPPPWSGAERLTPAELLVVEGWIDAGAPI